MCRRSQCSLDSFCYKRSGNVWFGNWRFGYEKIVSVLGNSMKIINGIFYYQMSHYEFSIACLSWRGMVPRTGKNTQQGKMNSQKVLRIHAWISNWGQVEVQGQRGRERGSLSHCPRFHEYFAIQDSPASCIYMIKVRIQYLAWTPRTDNKFMICRYKLSLPFSIFRIIVTTFLSIS
jgi:hypothetical protein